MTNPRFNMMCVEFPFSSTYTTLIMIADKNACTPAAILKRRWGTSRTSSFPHGIFFGLSANTHTFHRAPPGRPSRLEKLAAYFTVFPVLLPHGIVRSLARFGQCALKVNMKTWATTKAPVWISSAKDFSAYLAWTKGIWCSRSQTRRRNCSYATFCTTRLRAKMVSAFLWLEHIFALPTRAR